MSCPDADTLAAIVAGAVDDAERAAIVDHAAGCASCHAVLADLVATDLPNEATIDAHAASGETQATEPRIVIRGGADPVQIDRYRIERRLGAGAMGVVYAAHDPELDRPVAIKVLRPGASADRLRREAQALARLSHPNVVGVYDVGDHAGGVFVAMALVDGVNLRAWLGAARTTEAILDVITQAGRGVAAAHAAGIVHRDLKPDNIFVGRGGEVLVGDFGLARSDGEASIGSVTSSAAVAGAVFASEASGELTRTGTLLGTPAYMAPEQATGATSISSDQFSLCVTAWEALFVSRPFAGRTIDELIAAARRGDIAEPAAGRRVPPHVVRALRRGLAGDPAKRHPSVAALIAALTRRRIRWPLLAGAAAVTLAATITVVMVTMRGEAPDPCGDPGTLASAWSPSDRVQLAARLAALPETAPGFVTAALHDVDAYVTGWSELRHQSCLAAQVRHEQRAETTEQIARCLESRAVTARSIVESVGVDPSESAPRVLARLEALEPVERCRDVDPAAAPPGASADRLAAELDELELRFRAGHPLTGLDLDALVARARAIGHAGTTARTLIFVGGVKLVRAMTGEAELELREALALADTARDDRRRAQAAAVLAELLARCGRLREATSVRDLARSALVRAGSDPFVDGVVTHAGATVARARADAAAEIAGLRRVVELAVAQHGKVSLGAGLAWGELAYALQRGGDPSFERALDEQARALAPLVSPHRELDEVTR